MLLLAAALAAEQFNEQGIALAAYQSIASFDEKKAVAALEQAFAKAELLKDTTAMLNTVSKLHFLKPYNRAYADRLIYLQLICGRGLEVASLEVVSSPDSVGNEQALREFLQALAAYRFSDSERMKQHLMRIEKLEAFSAGQRAAYAGMLSKAGKTSMAFQIAEKISKSQLLPEELELLKVAL